MPAMFDQEILTIPEAAKMVGVGPRTIRQAIRHKKLPAFIVGGRTPNRSGAGLGYRIRKNDLQRWYFGEDAAVKEPYYMPPDGHPDV
jgi:excisionase family DNA binding protein